MERNKILFGLLKLSVAIHNKPTIQENDLFKKCEYNNLKKAGERKNEKRTSVEITVSPCPALKHLLNPSVNIKCIYYIRYILFIFITYMSNNNLLPQ